MPWTGSSFAKHNKSFSPQQDAHAARIANAVLKRSGDEGMAIAVANKNARAQGGGIGAFAVTAPKDWTDNLSRVRPGTFETDKTMDRKPPAAKTDRDLELYPPRPGEKPTAVPNQAARGGIVRHYDTGGAAPSIGGIAPTASMMNPMTQGYLQRFAQMPTEKLQELAARFGGSPQGQMIQRVLSQKQMMPNVGAAPPQQDQQPEGYAQGGQMIGMSMASPWWERREASEDFRPETGFLHSTVPGRTDKINMSPPAGSYVLPADVISGLGEGNSLAGARIMSEALNSGPYGIPQPRAPREHTMPRPPRPLPPESQGGRHNSPVPIVAAGGEMVLSPDEVMRIGGGNVKRGHDILDRFVVHVRKKTAQEMLKLPGPKKS